MVRAASQVPFTPIHHLEVSHAFQLLVGRGLITEDQRRAVQGQLQGDLENHRLDVVPLDLDRVFADARQLSGAYTARFLARSFDRLHLAAARLVGCRTFVSADDRQLAVAKAAGR